MSAKEMALFCMIYWVEKSSYLMVLKILSAWGFVSMAFRSLMTHISTRVLLMFLSI